MGEYTESSPLSPNTEILLPNRNNIVENGSERDPLQSNGHTKEDPVMTRAIGTNITSEVEKFTEGDPLHPNGHATGEKPVRIITVEPTMVLLVLGFLVSMLATQNLSLEKACRVNLNFTDEVCKSLKMQGVDSENENEKIVQQLLAKYIGSRTYISATIPCVIALFAGSYSDKTGRRKIFLIVSLVGQIIVCINNMLNVYFFYELNLAFLTFSEAAIEGFSGGWTLPFFIMFAYVSSITTEKNRTFRIGLLNFAMTVGFPLGMGLSGILLKRTGYYGAYGVALGTHSINLMYNLFILRDPPRTPEQKKHDNKGVAYFFRLFFSLKAIQESSQVVLRNGPNNRRTRMLIYLLCVCILFGPLFGEISVMYLFTRYRFNWDEVKFSIFQSYNFITHTVGTIFSLTVFSKLLGWHDSMLGIISVTSKMASSFVYCFAPNGNVFFAAPMVEILNGTSLLAMRSLLSKLVEVDELGKVSSIISLTENLMPLLYVPLYTNVYRLTMEVLPGAIFLMGAAFISPALVVFIYLFYEHRKGLKKTPKQAS